MAKNHRHSNRRRVLIFLAPAIVLLGAFLVVGYAMRHQDTDSLDNRVIEFLGKRAYYSDIVVLARVRSIEVKDQDRGIYTYVTVEPLEFLKGSSEEPIIIRHAGGIVGKKFSIVSGDIPNSSDWIIGQEVLLFLESVQVQGFTYYVSGDSGKLNVVYTPNGKEVFQLSPFVAPDQPSLSLKKEPTDLQSGQSSSSLTKEKVLEYLRSLH